MEDVELRTVSLKAPLNRAMTKDSDCVEESLETSKGMVTVGWKGDRSKPLLLTYHDLGLNYVSNFQAFFNYPDVQEIAKSFWVLHINAPGQEDGAATIPDDKEYLSMDGLAEQVNEILNHFSAVRYIGIGVGLGGNVLLRHALRYPERVDSLMLVNTLVTAPGWIEWGYQKRNIGHLRSHGVTQAVLDYLMWHHLGSGAEYRAHDLVSVYQNFFSHDVNGRNLAKLAEQYIWRTAVALDRDSTTGARADHSKTLKVPVLNVVGAYSPFLEETVTMNGKLNPELTNWIKIQDAAMVLEEQPGKVAEAFKFFLQGQGYCLHIRKSFYRSEG